MSRRLLVGLLVVLSIIAFIVAQAPAPAAGQGQCPGINRPLVPYAGETLTVANSAVAFTVATYTAGGSAPVMVIADVQVAALNYRDDGTAPTSSVGHNAHVGAVLTICGGSIGRFQAIRQGSTSAVLQSTFYR